MLNMRVVEDLFSAVDSEAEKDSAFEDHFVAEEKFAHFSSDAAFRVVIGNKGTGKSAFLRKYGKIAESRPGSVVIRLDPSDLVSRMGDVPDDPIKAIGAWRKFFATEAATNILSEKAASFIGEKSGAAFAAAHGFFTWLRKLANENLKGAADLVFEHGHNLDELSSVEFLIDDLDRGWDGRPNGAYFVSTMLSAAFDVSRKDPSIKFRISLRWDIFDRVIRVNADVDKMRPNFTHLTWTLHEVYVIIAKRISTYFNNDLDASYVIKHEIPQAELEKFYDPVIESRFRGFGGWSNTSMRHVLLAMIRRRPRDLLALLHLAGLDAVSKKKKAIDTNSLENIFYQFSENRLLDLVME